GRQSPDRCMKLAVALGLGDAIVFIPPTENVFQWYAAADAVILLSWYDPCSRVVLEAAGWGIPSITTRFNGAAEAFAGGGCIVVDSPRDTSAIVAGYAALADPATRKEHSQACIRLGDYLSLERHIKELIDAYQRAPKIR
ncbi:MAG: glycosyltransferase family 4 protein, partial [bacterium]|nr:glycosyltransferase family 4 protein [bacterium]